MERSQQSHSLGRRARIALAVVVGVVALFALADVVTSSPALCGSCHEMQPSHVSWAESAHTGVRCVTCHETPREWYARPATLAERSRLLSRDTWRHLTGRLGEPADPRVIGRTSPMPDEICLRCHDPNRKATSGFRILIDHPEHAKRTGSCVACHVYTAHTDPVLGRPLSLMTRCFDCHGTPGEPDAPATCETCHPSGFDLRPASHLEDPWMRDHGFSVSADSPFCTMCHQQSYCDSCHGLEMPHPEGWLGGDFGHAVFAEREREVCEQCHTEKPDSCTVCHHRTFDAARGSWVDQHFLEARTAGVVSCMECHSPLSCAQCHKAPAGVPEP